MRILRSFTTIKNIFIILLLIFFITILKCALQTDKLDLPNKNYNLQKDGFVVIKNVLTNSELKELQKNCYQNDYYTAKNSLIYNKYLLDSVKNHIKHNDYVFQDYIWIIKKSSVHTCHRDNNGDFFNENQKFPSYTLLVYLEDAEKCLGVVPYSHHNLNSYNVNFNDVVNYLPCKKGDVILFNANLIHVGALNKKDNLRIQMKITHKDDLETISYYQDYNKVLDTENNVPFTIKHIQKNVSCMFPFISNLTQSENIRTSRGSTDGVQIGFFQKIFSYLFYGNSKFYDLPNAF
jgi:hypothetical protein